MDYSFRTVCVVGLGYIGLPTAATLASRGVEVIGVDINPTMNATSSSGAAARASKGHELLKPGRGRIIKHEARCSPELVDERVKCAVFVIRRAEIAQADWGSA
jgi:UDP-N-acetyl-D-mannosaminuronic acid dehydrogenase